MKNNILKSIGRSIFPKCNQLLEQTWASGAARLSIRINKLTYNSSFDSGHINIKKKCILLNYYNYNQ